MRGRLLNSTNIAMAKQFSTIQKCAFGFAIAPPLLPHKLRVACVGAGVRSHL